MSHKRKHAHLLPLCAVWPYFWRRRRRGGSWFWLCSLSSVYQSCVVEGQLLSTPLPLLCPPPQFPENNVIKSLSERDFQRGSLTNHCGSGRKWSGKRPPQAAVPRRSKLRCWTQGRQEPGFVLGGRLWRGDPGSTGEGNQEPVSALAREEPCPLCHRRRDALLEGAKYPVTDRSSVG